MIDKKNAMEAFRAYTAQYDPGVPMIMHKIRHSARVCANAERIALSIKPALSEEDVRFAWLLGLVHDIGRFEQVRRYHTFIDSVSVDHAELSADILFRDGLIRSFTGGELGKEDERTAETAVRTHNKLTLPEGLNERAQQFCHILRDADKTDIFRLVAEMPFEERVGSSRSLFTDAEEACPEVIIYKAFVQRMVDGSEDIVQDFFQALQLFLTVGQHVNVVALQLIVFKCLGEQFKVLVEQGLGLDVEADFGGW